MYKLHNRSEKNEDSIIIRIVDHFYVVRSEGAPENEANWPFSPNAKRAVCKGRANPYTKDKIIVSASYKSVNREFIKQLTTIYDSLHIK